jgi:CHAD domain-containing protein
MAVATTDAGSTEREVKLGVPADFELPDLVGVLPDVDVTEGETLVLDAVYYDTPDLRLDAHGVSLRRRTGEGPTRWTLKLPEGGDGGTDDGSMVRKEIEVESNARQVPARLRGLITAFVRSSPLEPVARLRTTRRILVLSADSGEACEIADDVVEVIDGKQVVDTFREVEVEAKTDGDELLMTVVDLFRRAGAGTPDQTAKVSRVLAGRTVERVELTPIGVGKDATLAELARSALIDSARLVIDRDHVIRLDDDIEGVHRSRVGTRRLRSQLKLLGDVLEPGPTRALEVDLEWFADELGRVRDSDVLLGHLRDAVGDLSDDDRPHGAALIARLQKQRDAQVGVLHKNMKTDRYQRMLEQLVAYVEAPPIISGSDGKARPIVTPWVRDRYRKLRRDVANLPAHPHDDDLHTIRKRAKRLRYASEMATPVSGARARKFAKRLADLQDVLGELQDTVVLRAWLRETAAGPGVSRPQAMVAGLLIGRQEARARELRGEWPGTWKRIVRKKLTRWMR